MSEWISVEDRYPDEGKTCLLSCLDVFNGEEHQDTRIGYIRDGRVWIEYDQDGFTELSDITHWQPLPDPPQ